MELVAWIGANYAELLTGALQIVGGASLIVKLTPTLADDHALAWLQKALSFVSLAKK